MDGCLNKKTHDKEPPLGSGYSSLFSFLFLPSACGQYCFDERFNFIFFSSYVFALLSSLFYDFF